MSDGNMVMILHSNTSGIQLAKFVSKTQFDEDFAPIYSRVTDDRTLHFCTVEYISVHFEYIFVFCLHFRIFEYILSILNTFL